jgi:hypothetical protein
MTFVSGRISPTSRRRQTAVIAAAALGVLSIVPEFSAAHAATSSTSSRCPAAESLVPGTTWHSHKLAPGVELANGEKSDSRGQVKMHVLRINVAQRGVSFAPLKHSLANRSTLSSLAAGHSRLVAATNTGYFDFFSGAPTGPLIEHRLPYVLSSTHEVVAGLGTNGHGQSGHVWLSGRVTIGGKTHSVAGINELDQASGIEVVSRAWGSRQLPGVHRGLGGFRNGGSSINARAVVGGAIEAAQHGQDTLPSSGYMLIGRSAAATSWLDAIPNGTKIGLKLAVKTDAPKPFAQAYGVGAEYVETAGQIRTDLGCSSANTRQPARTSIGFANGGKTMIIAVVEDHPGTSVHGLDESQMSELMVQLGAQTAFAWDGSGSSELLAKLHGQPLKRLTYPADGAERPMPVGFGISYHKPKVKKKHKKH